MTINLGKWTEIENNLLLAGASNELMIERTGRTMGAIMTARSKLNGMLGRKIKQIPDARFLAEERAKLREIKRQKSLATTAPASKTEKETPRPKKVIDIDEMRKERNWKPLPSGAGIVFLKNDLGNPSNKVILRDNIAKHKGTLADQKTPVDPKTIHGEIGVAPFTKVEPEPLSPETTEAIKKLEVTHLPPSKDELFFEVNGTRVTVAAGTKKVDIMPYGLIIEF